MAHVKRGNLLSPGSRVPDFRIERLEGGETALRELTANGPVLLAFFKVSCPVCQMTLPFLDRINTPERLPIYTISQNEAKDTREFNQRFGVALPALLDSERAGFPISNAFGISSVPTMFLVEPDGSISKVIEGWNKAEVAALGAIAGINPFQASDSVPEWKAG